MSSSEEDEVMAAKGIPAELIHDANAAIDNLLPRKSKSLYEKTYSLFKDWCLDKKVQRITEDVVLAYLEQKSRQVKSPTLWSTFSMLKSTLNVKENINLGKFPKLIPYLKSKSVDYHGKKSAILTKDDIEKFLAEAEDTDYLLMKTVLILGVYGACRRMELTNMGVGDVEDMGHILVVKVVDTKTHRDRTFTVSRFEYIEIYRKYNNLLPSYTTSSRLFLKYAKGRCVNQNVGINKIGEIPSLIAAFLKKNYPKSYTGHCFRRSSTTLLANAVGDLLTIKRHGGWKSSSVAEGYIEDSLDNKTKIANKILNTASTSGEVGILNTASTSGELGSKSCATIVSSSELRNFNINAPEMSPSVKLIEKCSNFTINIHYNNK